MNVLLDTCVFIDFLGRKQPFYSQAEQIVAAGYFGDAKLWVSVQSIKDAFYVLRRFVDADKVQGAIEQALTVICPVDTTGQDALRALHLRWTDFEDCMISVCAEKAKADCIITRDTKGFVRSSVPAISPEEWLQKQHDQGISYGAVDVS